jgi:hypothetical protein
MSFQTLKTPLTPGDAAALEETDQQVLRCTVMDKAGWQVKIE